jgi:hypothetical protein
MKPRARVAEEITGAVLKTYSKKTSFEKPERILLDIKLMTAFIL